MIQYKRITILNDRFRRVNMNFNRFWTIYEASFPPTERRSSEQQKEILEYTNYHVVPIIHEGEEAGFFTYWKLDGFLFGEHLAVDEKYRNSGLGRIFLTSFFETLNEPFVIEVEKPTTEIADRRIAFYERLGFVLNHYDYEQPSYTGLTEPVPMFIMTYQEAIDESRFNAYKEQLYKTVYKCF